MNPIRTYILPRNEIAQFIPQKRGQMAFEALQHDATAQYSAIQTGEFLTLTADANLGSERVLTPVPGDLVGTDSGSGGTYTLGLANTAVVAGSYGSASAVVALQVDAKGRIIAAAQAALVSDNVAEGTTHLFYSDARARASLSGGTGIAYSPSAGMIAIDATVVTLTDAQTLSNKTLAAPVIMTGLAGYLKANGAAPVTASATIPVGDIAGLGTMATQNAAAVAITGGAAALSTLDAGSVGIGNTSPQYTCDITGTLRATPDGTSYGVGATVMISPDSSSIAVCCSAAAAFSPMQMFTASTQVGYIYSNTTGTSYNTVSDERIKENIKDATFDSGTIIDAVKVRSFDFINTNVHIRCGTVAQELREAIPEAVTVPEDGESLLGIDYAKAVPLLIMEIQALRRRVAALEVAPLRG